MFPAGPARLVVVVAGPSLDVVEASMGALAMLSFCAALYTPSVEKRWSNSRNDYPTLGALDVRHAFLPLARDAA